MASAHWSASYGRSILVERYLVCDDDDDRLDARCVGPVAAAAQLRADLRDVVVQADRNNDAEVDPARDAAVFAAYFDMRETVPALRELLRMPMPADAVGTHAQMEVMALRAEAAWALAELGDDASAPEIAALVRTLETEGHGTLWEDTVRALTRVSAPAASRYAIDFLGRIELQDLRMSMPGGSSQLVVLEPILAARDREALPALQRLTAIDDLFGRGETALEIPDSHGFCKFAAARVQLGEQPLRDRVRKAFEGSYSGTHVATCDNALLRAFGDDPRDATMLLRHTGRDDLGFDRSMSLLAYDRIIALVAALSGRDDAAAVRARKLLREGLRERSGFPHVADPGHSNFAPHYVALHHAALAGLGEAASAKRVHAMILDADDRSGVADLAALRALQLELPGAIEDAAARLVLDLGFENEERSGIFSGLRVRMLEALQHRAPDDPRWAVALLDPERDVRERAMRLFAHDTPAGACDAVLDVADAAAPVQWGRGIDDGLLVLTTRGDGCRPQLERIVADTTRAAKLRGMGLEALAILGAPLPRERAAWVRAEPDLRMPVERAEQIARRLHARPRGRGGDRTARGLSGGGKGT